MERICVCDAIERRDLLKAHLSALVTLRYCPAKPFRNFDSLDTANGPIASLAEMHAIRSIILSDLEVINRTVVPSRARAREREIALIFLNYN